MKKKNSTSDFSASRSRAMLENFRSAIAAQSKIEIKKAFQTVAEAPAPRFWVSEFRAAAVIGKMLSGNDPTPDMLPEKREMYRELYSRVLVLREANPDRSIYDLVFEAVNQPAPRNYMSPKRVMTIVYEEQKRLRRERLLKTDERRGGHE